jgi:hypothetical protein
MSEGRKGLSKGCIIALAVVGGLIVIFVALTILCIKNPDRLIEFGLKAVTAEMKENLPDEYTPEDVDRLIEDFVQGVRDEKVDSFEIEKIMQLGRDIASGQDLDKEELKEMIGEFLEEMQKAVED